MTPMAVAIIACVLSFIVGFMLCISLLGRALGEGFRDVLILVLQASKGMPKDDD